MQRITLLVAISSLFALASLSGCGKPAPDGGGSSKAGANAPKSGVIKIVSSLPHTGSAKKQADDIANGIQMAFEEVDFKVGDFTIEYERMDDATATAGKWDPTAEAANARNAANDPNVMAYLGPYNSGAAKNSIPILNEAGMLMISPAVTGVGFTKPDLGEPDEPGIYQKSGKKNFARVVPADDLQGTYGADWAKEMGVKRVYVLDDNEVYGKGLASIFRQRCEDLEIEVLGQQSIDFNEQDFKPLMTTIKAESPDLVYFGGTTQTKGGQICKEMFAIGLNCKLMVPDGCFEQAFIDAAGQDIPNDKVYVTFGGLPPEKQVGKGKEFVEKYQKKYGKTPEAYAIYGYEAANVTLAAIRQAGKKDRAAILDAAFAIKDFEGALGTWSFDKNGDTTVEQLSGNTIRDGKFEFVRILGDEGK